MNDAAQTFGTLRSLCQGAPSRAHFRDILQLLLVAEQRDTAQVDDEYVEYVDRALDAWPDDARVVYGTLAREIILANPVSARIVRQVDLSGFNLSDHAIMPLCRASHLTHITTLVLKQCQLAAGDITLICDAMAHPQRDMFSALHTLDLSKNWELGDEAFLTILRSSLSRTLRTLDYGGCGLRLSMDVHDLNLPTQSVEWLNLGMNNVLFDRLATLIEQGVWCNVRHLDVTNNVYGERSWNPIEPLFHTTRLEQISSLSISHCDARSLHEAPWLSQMDTLTCTLIEHMPSLLESPQLAQLTHLSVTQCDLSHESPLICAPFTSRLESLHINQCVNADTLIDALLHARHLTKLEELALTGYNAPAHEEGALPPSQGSFLALRRLSMTTCVLDAYTSSLCARSTWFHGLESLSLVHITAPQKSAEVLVHAPFTRLRHLELVGGALHVATYATLWRDALKDVRLDALILSQPGLDPEEITRWLQMPCAQTLTHLELRDMKLDASVIETLRDIPSVKQLAILSLAHCELDDDALKPLLSARCLERVRTLHLQKNLLTVRGVRALFRDRSLEHLEELEICAQHTAYDTHDHKGETAMLMTLFNSALIEQLRHVDIPMDAHKKHASLWRHWLTLSPAP